MTIFTDSGTIASVTAVTSTELYAAVEVLRITSKTTPSGVDHGPVVDFATVLTTTTPLYEEFYVAPAGYWGSADVDDGII